jgi:transcriptional regulator with XRE-family HTH domain
MLKEVLVRAMHERGLSTREAAKEIGVSHSTVFRITRGDPFDVPTLIAVANWLGVRPSTLLDNIGQSDAITETAMLVENVPGILDVLKDAVKAIQAGKADPAIITDIISYASYKLSLQSKKDAVKQR